MKVTRDSLSSRISGEEALVSLRYHEILRRREAEQVMEDLDAIITEHAFSQMILDCRAVAQISSVFLGKLVLLHRNLKESGRSLKLFGMTNEVAQAFRYCNLHQLIPTFDTLAEARGK